MEYLQEENRVLRDCLGHFDRGYALSSSLGEIALLTSTRQFALRECRSQFTKRVLYEEVTSSARTRADQTVYDEPQARDCPGLFCIPLYSKTYAICFAESGALRFALPPPGCGQNRIRFLSIPETEPRTL